MNYWGPNLARNFDRLDNCRVTWICDRDEAVLDRHRPAYRNSRFTSRYEDLLEDPDLDAVVIATPVPTHAPLARLALEADKDAFVEKPLALTARDANELAALADARERVLMVDHLLVYHPAVQKLHDLIREGALGRVFYLYGNRQNLGIVRPDENALWSLGPARHLRDAAPGGRAPRRGLGHRRELPPAGRGGRGVRAHPVPVRHPRAPAPELAGPAEDARMTVIGSDRMVVFDDMETERKVTVYDKGPIPRTETYGEYIQVRSGDIHIPKVSGTEPLRVVCDRFVQAVRDRGATPSDGWAGATVVEVLEAMGESLAQGGRPVALAGAVA